MKQRKFIHIPSPKSLFLSHFFFLQVLANNFAYIYTDFPMCHLTNKCQDLIKSVIREASVETLEHLLYHSITTMLSEMNKGIQPNRVFLHLDSSQTEINFTDDSGKLNLQKFMQYSTFLLLFFFRQF